jgi:hypothetical protein
MKSQVPNDYTGYKNERAFPLSVRNLRCVDKPWNILTVVPSSGCGEGSRLSLGSEDGDALLDGFKETEGSPDGATLKLGS